MTSFEMWVIGGLLSVISLLVGVVWNQLAQRIKLHEESTTEKLKDQGIHIGKHYSEINDLRVEQRELRTHISNHVDKFDEISKGIEALRDMIVDGLNHLNDKLDNWRERREPRP